MIPSSSEPAPATLLPTVELLAAQAGAMIRDEFHRPCGPRGSGSKAPVDTEVELFLKERLLALHSCNFLGEETEAVRTSSQDVWVVDPQDGTTDFLAGLRGSSVSVALVRRGRPVLGVVFAPLAPDDDGDLIAWAQGAALTRKGRPVVQSAADEFMVIAMAAPAGDHAKHNHETLPGFRVLALPSPAYRLALAAVGEVAAGVSMVHGLYHWDVAGGHALLVGAGYALVERSGRPIDYSRPSFDGCIGGHPGVVRRLLALRPRRGAFEARNGVRPDRRTADAAQLSRAQGCLLGQLTGDALGSAVEFQSAVEIARRHPQGVTRLTDGGTWDLIAGQPTDDSEMALALARSVVSNRGFERDAVASTYVRWGASKPFDIGSTTASGIRAIASGRRAVSDSQANGALMRVSPLGIFATGNPALAAKLATADAKLTHPHPVCLAASAAYCAAISVGVAGGSVEDMFTAARDHAGEGHGAAIIRQSLATARREEPLDYERQMGWVLTAFQNAFHHLYTGTALTAAVSRTVGHGGDTDTNAAICGALLGALQGRDAIPQQWRNAVLSCRTMPASGIRHPRPTEYWPDDALDLAEALLVAAPDEARRCAATHLPLRIPSDCRVRRGEVIGAVDAETRSSDGAFALSVRSEALPKEARTRPYTRASSDLLHKSATIQSQRKDFKDQERQVRHVADNGKTAKYSILVLGQKIYTSSLADLLVTVLQRLEGNFAGTLERLSQMSRGKTPYSRKKLD